METPFVTRRGFLGGALVASAAAALGGALAAPEVPAGAVSAGRPAPLSEAAFRPLVGSTFEVSTGTSPTPVTLVSVTTLTMANLPHHAVAGKVKTTGDQFSLQFQGAAGPSFPQGTYTITNPGLGSVELFLVPVGPPAAAPAYQAVIVSV